MPFCTNCGAAVDGSDAVCPSCGQPMQQPESVAPAYTPEPTPAPTYQAPYTPEPTPTYQAPQQAYQVPPTQQYSYPAAAPAAANPKGSIGWAILGFFIPIVGLILFFVWKKDRPGDAKKALIGGIIGFVVGIIMSIVSCLGLAWLGSTVDQQTTYPSTSTTTTTTTTTTNPAPAPANYDANFQGHWKLYSMKDGGEELDHNMVQLAEQAGYVVTMDLNADKSMKLTAGEDIISGTWKAKDANTVVLESDGETITGTLESNGMVTLKEGSTSMTFERK